MNDFLAAQERQAFVIARLSTGDEADALDVLQDAMLAFARHYADKPIEQWRPLFFRVVYSKLTDFHRRKKFRQGILRLFGHADDITGAEREAQLVSEQDQFPATDPEPALQLQTQDSMMAIEQALGQLPQRQQQAVVLRAWQGMDTEEAARAMSVTTSSVKTHYARGLAKLRLILGQDPGEHWP